jgi:hypothetical protein
MTGQEISAMLPEIVTGSEKQIAWAERKRSAACSALATELEHGRRVLDGTLTVLYGVRTIDAMIARAKAKAAGLSPADEKAAVRDRVQIEDTDFLMAELARLVRKGAESWTDAASAKWWIDGGSLSLAALVEAGARVEANSRE